jgi:hypothetical protein
VREQEIFFFSHPRLVAKIFIPIVAAHHKAVPTRCTITIAAKQRFTIWT